MDVDTTGQKLQASNILDNINAKSVIFKGKLSAAELQAVVSNIYGKLQFAFNNFRDIFNKNC